MHVCFLLANEFPADGRHRTHAAALSEAGHTVTVCARGASDDTDREISAGIDVRRLPDDGLYAGAKGKLDGARYALRFAQPAWVRTVGDIDDEQAIDVCCVRDLSLVKTGLRIRDKLDVPVVCDLPNPTLAAGAGDTSRGGRVRGIARRVFHPSWRRNRLVTKSLLDVDQLITTTEEARAQYVREKGIDPRRVAVVRDTADSSLGSTVESHNLEFDTENSFVVTAIGDGDVDDLEPVVEAAARAADRAVALRLALVGDIGSEVREDLETLARRRLAGGRVTFQTDTDHTTEYIAASDVCVFPPTTEETETAIPIVFEAMAMGVPVVVSDETSLSSLVSRTNAGRVVPGENNEALAEALVSLSDPEIATELGENGRAAVEREYNWERDTDRLLEIYESVSEEYQAESQNGPESRFVSAIRDDP
ncbi:MAG TPA: glycosyltransferase, partial [Halococcus sp.]|nr:glycosyltransferase [Halococcus sp.]